MRPPKLLPVCDAFVEMGCSTAARRGRRIMSAWAHPEFLAVMFALGAVTCLASAAVVARDAPPVAFGLIGAVIGELAGFLNESADGPAEVPAYTTVGASIGLVVCALAALVGTSPDAPSRPLRVGAALVAIATPIATAGLVALLQLACPLYVNGPDAGSATTGSTIFSAAGSRASPSP
jgi:hypothetical protein